MSIGIKVDDCDDRLNTFLKTACIMSPSTLPIKWAAVNIIVRPNSRFCLSEQHRIQFLISISLDASSDFPCKRCRQNRRYLNLIMNALCCVMIPLGCFTLLIAKLALQICINHLPVIPLASDCFIVGAQCTYCKRILVFYLEVLRIHCDWIVAGRPSES